MQRPFHYSFSVRDLNEARRFYGELLGCREGRSAETWVDFDFFGNQISVHLAETPPARTAVGHVDGIEVPIPHFGAIVDMDQFDQIAIRLEGSGIRFLIPPRVRFPGQPGEQRTMFFLDPSGNALELKAFKRAEGMFEA